MVSIIRLMKISSKNGFSFFVLSCLSQDSLLLSAPVSNFLVVWGHCDYWSLPFRMANVWPTCVGQVRLAGSCHQTPTHQWFSTRQLMTFSQFFGSLSSLLTAIQALLLMETLPSSHSISLDNTNIVWSKGRSGEACAGVFTDLERSHVTFAHTPLEGNLSCDQLKMCPEKKRLDFAAKMPQPGPKTNKCLYVDLMPLLISFK